MIGIHKNIKSASKTTKEIPFAGSFLGLALAKKIIELDDSLNENMKRGVLKIRLRGLIDLQ